jgi:hypothetical protein
MTKEKVITLFGKDWKVEACNHYKLGQGFEIDFTEQYTAPELSLKNMTEVAEYFGTLDIDFDHVSEGGCETCDYGSRYGYTIQVYNATKNVPNL